MTVTYFNYLIVFLFVILCFYQFGRFLFWTLKIRIDKPFTETFAWLLTSTTIFVLLVSLYYTKGATINIFLLPIFLFLIHCQRAEAKKNQRLPYLKLKHWTFYAIVAFSCFLFFGLRLGQIYNNNNTPLPPHSDLVFYANCADFLIHFGNENSAVDYVYGAGLGTSPYHYFEIWFCAGISSIFGINTALSLTLVCLSFGLVVIGLGLCAILEYFKPVRPIDAALCLLLVFITGLAFDIYTEIPFLKYIYVYCQNSWSYPKLFPVYFFCIASILFLLHGKVKEGIVSLLILPVISIATGIGIFGGIITWLVLDYLTTRTKRISLWVMTVGTAFGILLFYKLLTHQANTHVNIDAGSILGNFMQVSFIKTFINICGGAVLQTILIFSPFLILLVLFRKEMFTRSIYRDIKLQLLVFIYLYALVGWGLMHDKLSSVQLFSNISVVLFNLSATLCILLVWTKPHKSPVLKFLCIFILVTASVQISTRKYRYDYGQNSEYIDRVLRESDHFSRVGAFVMDEDYYQASEFSYVANFDILGKYLIYSKSKTFPLSISPFSFVYSSNPMVKSIQMGSNKNTPFYVFVEQQKKNRTFESIAKSQLQFIDELNINYIIHTKGMVLPAVLRQRIQKEIVDPDSGEHFCILSGK